MINIKTNEICNKILFLVCAGKKDVQIATILGYSPATIKYYIHEMLNIYKAHNRAHLACKYLVKNIESYQKNKELLNF